MAYHEFTFELEQETCKCQLAVQQLPMSNIKARSQIHKVICGMLDNMSSNDPLSDELISQLQKIMIYLENTKSSEYSKLNELEDLVENYSVVGFNEIVIKNRLLEIAKNLIDNDHDGRCYDNYCLFSIEFLMYIIILIIFIIFSYFIRSDVSRN